MKYLNRLIGVVCLFCFLRVIYLDVFVSLKTVYTTNDKLPLIYIITPTRVKLEQKADLTRLSQTLQLVPNIHWIVVEDSENKTDRVTRFLQRCVVPNTHLNVNSYSRTELKTKFSELEKLRFHRGTRQRNLALDWLENNSVFPSVVYFADDDNSYDIQIFEEMRHTKRVSVWPVGLCGASRFQSPALSDGKVVGWLVGLGQYRKFGIDMAGFAVNGEFLRKRKARFPLVDMRSPETYFLEHLNITLDDLEPRADNCTKELMSQKAEKPSLSGQRLKTRKRDEKEKYDPSAFRDAVIQSLNECGTDLEQVSKFLDGSKLDYRRYSDVLFDILIAGGILAPGGSIVEDPDQTKPSRTSVCVFGCEEDRNSLKAFVDVFNKLLRRYKYLEKSFEEGIKKALVFLKGFKSDEQEKLAIFLGIIFANGLCKPQVLVSLFEDHLVKEGISLRFATMMFRSWLVDKDIGSMAKALKGAQLDARLLELFPVNKRSQEAFVTHFKKEGLDAVANFQGKQQISELKKKLQERLSEMVSNEDNPKEIVAYLSEQLQKHEINQAEIVVHVWNTLMAQVEWNKKEELVAEQALKHLKKYAIVLGEMAKTAEAELKLLVKVQEYCYDNMAFMKVFQKIVVLLYNTDVLSEDCIMKWYNGSHSSKGKSVFLEQMKTFVEWLKNAEEESEDEDD